MTRCARELICTDPYIYRVILFQTLRPNYNLPVCGTAFDLHWPVHLFLWSLHGWWWWTRLIVGFQPPMDCKLDSVVYVGVCVWVNVDLSWLGQTIYARHFLGAKPPIQFRYRWAKRWITQTIYTDPERPSRLPKSSMPSTKLRSANLPLSTSLVWWRSGIESRPPTPRADALTTVLRRGGPAWRVFGVYLP